MITMVTRTVKVDKLFSWHRVFNVDKDENVLSLMVSANGKVYSITPTPETGGVYPIVAVCRCVDCVGGAYCASQEKSADYTYTAAGIPTLSEWGLIALALVLMAAGAFVLARRRRSLARSPGS